MSQDKKPYIVSMTGTIRNGRSYAGDKLELVVTVSFDAKQFNAIKKKSDPIAAGMAQIKNVVLDAAGVRGVPSYAPVSYGQMYPRASKGLVTLQLTFDVSEFATTALGADVTKYSLNHRVELNATLEATRADGHLFAKSALAAVMGH